MGLLGLIKYLELITAIAGTVYFKKYSHTPLKFFLFLLWFVVIVEFAIWGLKETGYIVQNNFIYNVITSIQYLYFFFFYYKTIKTASYKKYIQYFAILFLLGVLINFIWIQKLTVTAPFHSYTFIFGAMLLILTIGLFFSEILNSERVLYFKRYLLFWISIGLFVFYAGIIPLTLSFNFLPKFLNTDSLSIIFFTINLAMYSCFCAGFVLGNKLD